MKKALIFLFSTVLMLNFVSFAIEQNESVISSDGVVNENFAPDTARIRFYVENTGMNVADIKAKNDKTTTEAITKLKAVLKTNEEIKTIDFSIDSVYSYKDKVRVFQKYVVRNGFEVKLKDLTKVSDVIQIAMSAGVKEVQNISFSIENSEEICNDLIVKAGIIAKNRAMKLSSALGEQLDKPKSINPYCSLSANNRHYQTKAFMNSVATDGISEASTGAIQVGDMNVRATVNLTYYLK